MAKPVLVIGDKNLSSWSLRPWLAMKQGGIDFDEVVVRLDRPDTRERILRYSPTGKVPCLVDGSVHVWESIAICEYVAEAVPSLWPADKAARAVARAVSAEMHAGFVELRKACSMNLRRKPVAGETPALSEGAQRDVARVQELWRDCRARFGAGGPFLFGAFSIADAMYAPVATRFTSYGIARDDVAQRYIDAVWALPTMQQWLAAALAETA